MNTSIQPEKSKRQLKKEWEEWRDQARELQDFFTDTYADKALEAAITSRNTEVLALTVAHFGSLASQIEEAETLTCAQRH